MKRLAAVFILIGLTPATEPVRADDPGTPAGAGRDWAVYGGAPEATRYSRLTQIDRTNVRGLKVAWTYDTGDAYPGSELQCNPLVVDGVLYATTPKVNLVALDAATGALRWRFEPAEGKPVLGKRRNRGVTYWSRAARSKRIFFAVRHFLYSRGRRHRPARSRFGRDGRDRPARGPPAGREMESVGLSTPGIIYKDLLIVGEHDQRGACRPRPATSAPSTCGRARCAGASTPFPVPASRATRPGRRTPGSTRAAPTTGRAWPSTRGAGWCSCPPAPPPTTSTAPTGPATTCSRTRCSRSRPTPASASGTSRPCATTSGTATCPRRPPWSR